MYGDQLYVNCRNLRNNGVRLDVSGYTQAVRYDKDKVCVMAYKIDDGSFFLGIGLDVASVFVDNKAAKVGLGAAAIGTMIGNEFLSKTVCYLVDNDADVKGKIPVTRMNDQYMENLLNSLGREKVTYSLCQMTQGMMLKLVELNSEGMHFEEDRKAFFAKFFQYAVIGMILDWIIGGYELTPEVLVCRLYVMVNSALPAMLSGMDGALEEVRQGRF